ncbi:hypothetical protein ACQPYH_12770 [Kribbella sp. CA-245084]|uniref:hypothetical protein n=1 Tax=Kribbella sp. CA-245084 TaxID=3239940 RepID=UPI003D8C9CE9
MRLLLLTTAVLLTAGCSGGDPTEPAATAPESIKVTSTAFREGGAIPVEYTCDGAGTGLDEALKAVGAATVARGRLTATYKR